jgi:hypothetical protein
MNLLSELILQRFVPVADALENGKISRILIEDASAQAMPKANADEFPAHGNRHSAAAGAKIDPAYDLLAGEVDSHSLHLATGQDKDIRKSLIPRLLPGNLVLRDMGYLSLGEFAPVEVAGAWRLPQLPLIVGVSLEKGGTIEDALKRAKHDIIDLPADAGKQGKACRFAALRASPEVVDSRRKVRRDKA